LTLKVYDMQGREVAALLDEELTAGGHQVIWNAEMLRPGIYFYFLKTGNLSSNGKMVVVR
jgi:hypothetical protein